MERMKYCALVFSITILSLLANGQNSNLSNGSVFDGEPYITVNPSNPQHMVVAWMGYVFLNRIVIKTRTSFDGGNTWSPVQTTPHAMPDYTSADPSLAFDANGNVFLCMIDSRPDHTAGAIYLRKSTDGGLSWGSPVEVMDFNADPGKLAIDRPWICIDRSGGLMDGNIYITSMNAKGANGPPYHPYFNRSLDNGETFEPWRYADTTGWLAGSLIPQPMPTPLVTADGTFHCVYPSYVFSQNILPQYILATSTNAGTGFTYQTVLASWFTNAVTDTSAKKGYLLRADPSNSDHLAFIHLSNENGDSDISFRETYDSGETWSNSIRVNDDPVGNNRMQDLAWAAFDTDGDMVITWRDRRHAADTGYSASYEIYGAFRHRDSVNFSANFRISDGSIPFDDILLGSGNDFMSVELYNDTLSLVWGDTHTGTLNIWFQRMTINGAPVSVQQIAAEPLYDVNIRQGASAKTFEISAEMIDHINVSDLSGRSLINVNLPKNSDRYLLNLSAFPTAYYVITIKTQLGKTARKMYNN